MASRVCHRGLSLIDDGRLLRHGPQARRRRPPPRRLRAGAVAARGPAPRGRPYAWQREEGEPGEEQQQRQPALEARRVRPRELALHGAPRQETERERRGGAPPPPPPPPPRPGDCGGGGEPPQPSPAAAGAEALPSLAEQGCAPHAEEGRGVRGVGARVQGRPREEQMMGMMGWSSSITHHPSSIIPHPSIHPSIYHRRHHDRHHGDFWPLLPPPPSTTQCTIC
mmetsp:Transcript_15684/g.29603  ORF Transcript_15684/g.29603 Transcript_15684/m.29603 type:complete len:224 (-) Transcript_15684:40-711(-)